MPQDELAVYEKCGSYQGTLHSLTPGLAGEVVESTTIYLTHSYIYIRCTLYPAHNHNAPSGITRQCIDSKRFSAHDYVFSVKSHMSLNLFCENFPLFFRHSAAWLHLCWMRHLQHVLHHTCYIDAYQRAGCPVRHKDKGQRFCSYVSLISLYLRQRKGIEAPTPTQRANATVWDQCAVYILPILCVLLNSRGQWHEAKS